MDDGSETENFIIHFQSTFMIIDVRIVQLVDRGSNYKMTSL